MEENNNHYDVLGVYYIAKERSLRMCEINGCGALCVRTGAVKNV